MTWRQQALCQSAAVDFVVTNVSKGHLAYCNRCPVADPCLGYALSIDPGADIAGIYAGTCPADRRAMRKAAS